MIFLNESVVTLFAPTGNAQVVRYGVKNPREWATAKMSEILGGTTGTGRPLRDYPDVVAQIYGNGKWSFATSSRALTQKPAVVIYL